MTDYPEAFYYKLWHEIRLDWKRKISTRVACCLYLRVCLPTDHDHLQRFVTSQSLVQLLPEGKVDEGRLRDDLADVAAQSDSDDEAGSQVQSLMGCRY